ncbi:DinB family protein [Spirosoma koreense]
MQKELLLDMLLQNQTTCGFAFSRITPATLDLRLNDQTASIGFIYRHIGETLNLFGLFLGLPTAVGNTTMGQTDTGQGSDLDTSRSLVDDGFRRLEAYVKATPDAAWLDPIDTPFFGPVSRMRLFAHILFHNAHHAGQISLTLNRSPEAGDQPGRFAER